MRHASEPKSVPEAKDGSGLRATEERSLNGFSVRIVYSPRRKKTVSARLMGVLLDACRRRGVPVANVPGYSTPAVAQHVFSLLLTLCQCPDRYNAAVARQVDDFRDFIRFHYVTERHDSAFWRDVAASHPDFVTERLALWQTRLPAHQDFEPFPLGLPHLQGQLYIPVLDGLGHLNRASAQAEMAADPKLRDRTRATHATLVAEYARAADQCMPHRAWLMSLSAG